MDEYYAYVETTQPGPRSPGETAETYPAVYRSPRFVQEYSGIGDTVFRRSVGVYSSAEAAWCAAEAAAKEM